VASLSLRIKVEEGSHSDSHNATGEHGEVAPVASKLVWFLGSSIDQHAVADACRDANAFINGDGTPHFYCTFDGFTLIYSFHPGATDPPYYAGTGAGVIHTTTTQTIYDRLAQIRQTFGKDPDATIVESSVWDAANWWQNRGEIPSSWPVPHERISGWCHNTIPIFLNFVHNAIPHSHIAFRSPPPAFNSGWKSWTQQLSQIVDEMHMCLCASTNTETHLLYGKYPFIDYYQVVQSTHKVLGGSLRQWYRDDIHPGPELGMAEVSAALKWVKGL
jgi:hypothetical protein